MTDRSDALELRYHNAMPGWCKIIGLRIKAIPECEGGGFAVRQDQAEAIVRSLAGDGVIAEIAAERKRQSEVEGWTTEHDDNHDEEQLARAVVCYAAPDWLRQSFEANDIGIWPWDLDWWKPKDRRRDLIRAAALLVAEIERLDRLSRKEPTNG